MLKQHITFEFIKTPMINMKSVLISLGLISTTFSSAFALTPPAPIPQQKQVSGYYQYQAGDVQITALKQFAEYAKGGQTIAAPHLPFPAIGHIYSADGKRYQWIPVHFKD